MKRINIFERLRKMDARDKADIATCVCIISTSLLIARIISTRKIEESNEEISEI